MEENTDEFQIPWFWKHGKVIHMHRKFALILTYLTTLWVQKMNSGLEFHWW